MSDPVQIAAEALAELRRLAEAANSPGTRRARTRRHAHYLAATGPDVLVTVLDCLEAAEARQRELEAQRDGLDAGYSEAGRLLRRIIRDHLGADFVDPEVGGSLAVCADMDAVGLAAWLHAELKDPGSAVPGAVAGEPESTPAADLPEEQRHHLLCDVPNAGSCFQPTCRCECHRARHPRAADTQEAHEALCGTALTGMDHPRCPRGVEVVCAACDLLVMIRDSAAAGSAPEKRGRGMSAALAQLPLVDPALVQLVTVNRAEANELLTRWGHYLGPCNRPFGQQHWALLAAGEPVSVAVSASTVSATVGPWARRQVVELARLCSGQRWATRPMLRLWREVAAPTWPHWPVEVAVAYSQNARHDGAIYRFDGWTKVTDRAGATGGGGTWSTPRRSTSPARGAKTLWSWTYPVPAVAVGERAPDPGSVP